MTTSENYSLKMSFAPNNLLTIMCHDTVMCYSSPERMLWKCDFYEKAINLIFFWAYVLYYFFVYLEIRGIKGYSSVDWAHALYKESWF